ncbi:MAG: hypothetical protein GQ558_03725 [Thermoplasmata archaeon]|nr:hypothetical protein [Thermoplasmata archaeon]
MDHRTMRRLWIKAAVEHRVVRLEYRGSSSDDGVVTRFVDPDFIGGWGGLSHLFPWSFRFWGSYDHEDGVGACCFQPADVVSLDITDRTFEPRSDGRWMEHLEEYQRLGLGDGTG